MAIEIEHQGRTMYARISPPLRITEWPSGQTTANIRVQLFLSREQRVADGVGRFERIEDGPLQHIPPIDLTGVVMPNGEPSIADAYAAIAKLEQFAGAASV